MVKAKKYISRNRYYSKNDEGFLRRNGRNTDYLSTVGEWRQKSIQVSRLLIEARRKEGNLVVVVERSSKWKIVSNIRLFDRFLSANVLFDPVFDIQTAKRRSFQRRRIGLILNYLKINTLVSSFSIYRRPTTTD